MAQLNYEIPDELHKYLKMLAADNGLTLKDQIIAYLTEAVTVYLPKMSSHNV